MYLKKCLLSLITKMQKHKVALFYGFCYAFLIGGMWFAAYILCVTMPGDNNMKPNQNLFNFFVHKLSFYLIPLFFVFRLYSLAMKKTKVGEFLIEIAVGIVLLIPSIFLYDFLLKILVSIKRTFFPWFMM